VDISPLQLIDPPGYAQRNGRAHKEFARDPQSIVDYDIYY